MRTVFLIPDAGGNADCNFVDRKDYRGCDKCPNCTGPASKTVRVDNWPVRR